MLALTLEHGKVVVSGYDSVTPLGSPSYPGGARQVAVTAPFGLPFPHTPQAVRPLGVIIRSASLLLLTSVFTGIQSVETRIGVCMFVFEVQL